MAAKLTSKQEQFCREFLIDNNATQAAIRAGYSPRTADVQGSRLLGNVKVGQRIAELREEQSRRLQVSADDVVRRYAEIAFSAGLGEFLEPQSRGRKLVLKKDIDPAKLFLLAEYQNTKEGAKLKSLPILEALQKLGEHFGLFDRDRGKAGEGGQMEPPPPVTFLPIDARTRDDPQSRSGKREAGGSGNSAEPEAV